MARATQNPGDGEIARLNAAARNAGYWNRDLAPVPPSARTWGMRDYLALWWSLAACIPVYILASGFIEGGMDWRQAVLTIFLGNAIVLIPMLLNAHAGAKYGIPFPVLCRASFGVRGANVPALLRALVACGWFGIQCWIGGWALYKILAAHWPGMAGPQLIIGINLGQLICYLLFWGITQFIVWRGIESVRLLFNIKMPLLIILAAALLVWAYNAADGFGPMLSQAPAFESDAEFWRFFFPALTANVGLWATLALNIPDFTRYARTQRAQITGQALGLPFAMGAYSFIGVAVTSATVIIFGRAVWDPVELLSLFENPAAQLAGLFGVLLATLATNLAANVVAPANDFANLFPRRVSFAQGALLTGAIGVALQPWRLVADPGGYIFTWLVAYSGLLGAIGGVMVADYYVLRRMRLDLRALYLPGGTYWYAGGFNRRALAALCAGIAPCVPGFLAQIGAVDAPAFWRTLYHYAWFLSFAVAFALHTGLGYRRARAAIINSGAAPEAAREDAS